MPRSLLLLLSVGAGAEAFAPGVRVDRIHSTRCAAGLSLPGRSFGTCPAELGLPKAFRGLRGGEAFMADSAVAEPETFEFEAEVGKVMDIIINSLYRYADRPLFRLNKNVLESRRHHALQNLT